MALVTYKSKHPDEARALDEARVILEQLAKLRRYLSDSPLKHLSA